MIWCLKFVISIDQHAFVRVYLRPRQLFSATSVTLRETWIFLIDHEVHEEHEEATHEALLVYNELRFTHLRDGLSQIKEATLPYFSPITPCSCSPKSCVINLS